MSKLNCDIKYMYRASTCHKFILVVVDKVTNYPVTIPLYRGTSYESVMCYVNMVPFLFNVWWGSSILSSVMQYIYKRLGIKVKTISTYNHGSLKTEWHIRTISEMIAKQLTDIGLMWTHYLETFTYIYVMGVQIKFNWGSIHFFACMLHLLGVKINWC